MIKLNLSLVTKYPFHVAAYLVALVTLLALGPPLPLSIGLVGTLIWLTTFFATRTDRSLAAVENLKTYNVYRHPRFGFEVVKVGFSWAALFLGFFWLLFSRLWLQSLLYLLALLALYFVGAYFSGSYTTYGDGEIAFGVASVFQLFCVFAVAIVPAIAGNEWRENNLAKRGFEHVKTVQVASKEEAISDVAV